jgi:hypothetical protein
MSDLEKAFKELTTSFEKKFSTSPKYKDERGKKFNFFFFCLIFFAACIAWYLFYYYYLRKNTV